MYNQEYEDYMRGVLGYDTNNMQFNNTYMPDDYSYFNNMNYDNLNEHEDLYPEIYRIVHPMVCKICDRNRHRPITEELITQMTDEIYNNIECNDEVRTEEVKKDVRDVKQNSTKTVENREYRQRNNPFLRDLIRILILRNLLRNHRPHRPGFPGQGPFPPRPPQPGPRPPFPGGPMRPNTRDYNLYY